MTACGRGCKAYHGRHVASATPPIRAPAFDGHGKAAPYPGLDDEPRKRPKYVHLRASRFAALHHFAETLERRRFSAPVLRPVPDIQDFDYFIRATVHNDVRGLASSRVPFTSPGRPRPGRVANCSMRSITACATFRAAVGLSCWMRLTAASSWSEASVVQRISLTSETAGRYG